jgi:hypothetical protein
MREKLQRTRYTGRMSDAPKSAFELAMERLRKKDAESGVTEKVLTDAQRAAIAEARSVCEAKMAERRIMHRSTVAGIFDPAELEERNRELRLDLERFESDRDAKIRKIRDADA